MAPSYSKTFLVLGVLLCFAEFIAGSPAWYGKKPLARNVDCCKCSGQSRNRYLRAAQRKPYREVRLLGRNEAQFEADFYGFARERPGELVEVDFEDRSERLYGLGSEDEEAEFFDAEFEGAERFESGQLKRGRGCSGDWQPCQTCSTSEIVETYQPPPKVEVVEYHQPSCKEQCPCDNNCCEESCCKSSCNSESPPPTPAPVPPPPFPAPPHCVPLPNPIVNGNFEAPGNALADWLSTSPFVTVGISTSGAPTYEALVTVPPQIGAVYHSAEFAVAANNAPATLSQPSVPVCPGTAYQLSFFLASDAAATSSNCSLAVNIGSQVIYASTIAVTNPTGGIINAGAAVVQFPGYPGYQGPFPGPFPYYNPGVPNPQGQPGSHGPGGFGQSVPGFGGPYQPPGGYGYPPPYPPPGVWGGGLSGPQPLSITVTCTNLAAGATAHVFVDEVNLQPIF